MLAFVGKPLDIPALKAIPVPVTPRWRPSDAPPTRWKPVNHGELAETLLDEASGMGLRIKSAQWGVSENGADLFGAVEFERLPGVPAAPGIDPALALRHGNQGRSAITLAFGGVVFVCKNGVLLGETRVQYRHTVDLDLGLALRHALERFTEESSGLALWEDDLSRAAVDERRATHLLVESARRKVVPWSLLQAVDKHWREPEHEEFRPRTAWSLYNAFTAAARKRGLAGQLDTLRGLRGLFVGVVMERRAASTAADKLRRAISDEGLAF